MKKENSESGLLYVAKKSAWAHGSRLVGGVVFAVLLVALAAFCFSRGAKLVGGVSLAAALIPVIVVLETILEAVKNEIRIYDKYIITRKGLINVKETRSVMTPIIGISVEQSVTGKIFNYGNVKIDKIGKGWDVDFKYIKKPDQFKMFLQDMMEKNDLSNTTMIMGN